MAGQEKSPLLLGKKQDGDRSALLNKKTQEPEVDIKHEFLSLTSMAFQVSLSTFARIALTSIDGAFLGHLGTNALAASSLASIWTSVPLTGVWAGASALITLCGQAWGAKNGNLAGIWLQMGLVITSILMVPVFIWYWCVGIALESSTEDTEVVALGVRFARILSFSIWPSLIYACVRLYFQSMGVMAPTTVVGALSIGVAVVANYYFIYGGFGWSGLGFDGSPLATVVASWFQPIALISYCIVYKKMHLQAWGGWDWNAFTPERITTFLSIAGPIASNSLVSSLANSALSLVAAKLGSDIIAANAVISGLWGLLWALFWGFGCATQIRVANYLGANRPQAAKTLGMLGFVCTIVTVITLATLTLSFHEAIFRVYTSDDDLLKLCMLVQPIFVCAYMIESIEMLTSSILTAMGQVKVTAWTSSLSVWFIELPFAYIGGVVLGYGFKALWYGICVMEVIKFCVFVFTLSRTDWQEMARIAVDTMEANPEDEEEQEAESIQFAVAEGGNTPVGYNPMTRSPAMALLTPVSRQKQWDQVEGGARQRGSFASPKRASSFSHA
uniref:Multidrug and toxin extrusion protein n=1 Tax=Globisporangium ultimum (strain ATCC 200006 / CBS 805.95 / DAOM BR144) TaxID=431595 RepID=K3X0N6_GLOUD